jgi:hypothetical protein
VFEKLKTILRLVKNDRRAQESVKQDDAVVSDRVIGNVLDLNDRFNRARYMDKDGD